MWLTSGSPAPRAPPPHFQGSSAWTGPPPVNRLWDPRELGRGSHPRIGSRTLQEPQPTGNPGRHPGGPEALPPRPHLRTPPRRVCAKLFCPEKAALGRAAQTPASPLLPPSFRGRRPRLPRLPHGVWLSPPLVQAPCDWTGLEGAVQRCSPRTGGGGPPEAWDLGGLRGLPSSPAAGSRREEGRSTSVQGGKAQGLWAGPMQEPPSLPSVLYRPLRKAQRSPWGPTHPAKGSRLGVCRGGPVHPPPPTQSPLPHALPISRMASAGAPRQSQVHSRGQHAALARAPASDLFPPPPPTPSLWGACRALGISADTQLGAAAQP